MGKVSTMMYIYHIKYIIFIDVVGFASKTTPDDAKRCVSNSSDSTSQHYPLPFTFNFIPQKSPNSIIAAFLCCTSLYATLAAFGIKPDHGTAPSVTGLSRFIPGIISYQLPTFPPGPALNSSAPEQRSTACHNWGRYRSPMAAILQCFSLPPFPPPIPPHPSMCLIAPQKPSPRVRLGESTRPRFGGQFVVYFLDLQPNQTFNEHWRL